MLVICVTNIKKFKNMQIQVVGRFTITAYNKLFLRNYTLDKRVLRGYVLINLSVQRVLVRARSVIFEVYSNMYARK